MVMALIKDSWNDVSGTAMPTCQSYLDFSNASASVPFYAYQFERLWYPKTQSNLGEDAHGFQLFRLIGFGTI
jgi:hypothetical protein